jgi:hypothetical protein
MRGDAMRQWGEIPPGTRVLLDQAAASPKPEPGPSPAPRGAGLVLLGHPAPAHALLGDAATSSTTTYLFPSGSVSTGAELDAEARGRRRLESLPSGTRVLVGYVSAGSVTRGQGPKRVAGNLWNRPSTYYRVPGGGIHTGAEVDPRQVPAGTLVFLRQ